MAPRLLTSPQAAERLGLPVQALYKLRDADEGLAITQTGLQIGYQLEDIAAYERREMLALAEQVLATARPLPLIRAMAQLQRSPPPSISAKLVSVPTAAVTDAATVTPTPISGPSPNTTAWFLVRTKPRQEGVALTNLARQGYEFYLPLFATEKTRPPQIHRRAGADVRALPARAARYIWPEPELEPDPLHRGGQRIGVLRQPARTGR